MGERRENERELEKNGRAIGRERASEREWRDTGERETGRERERERDRDREPETDGKRER